MSIWTQRVGHYSSEAGHAAGTKHIRSLQTVLLFRWNLSLDLLDPPLLRNPDVAT